MYAKDVKEFTDEVKFRVGQRVKVDLKIPVKVHCDTAIIFKINTNFMHTPKLRKIRYYIRFDDEYTKDPPVWTGIPEILVVSEDRLKPIKKEGIKNNSIPK